MTVQGAARGLAADAVRAAVRLPVGLVAVVLLPAGQGGRAARLQARVSRLSGWTGARAAGRALVGLPLDVAAFVVVAYSAFNTVRNLGYPIWYAASDYHQAWGGPTLAGVWAVHAFGWLACLVVVGLLVRWIGRGQAAVDRLVTGW